MAFEVKLPDIGEGVAEGEIVRWLVQRGDAVREDQPLVEVMTDKATVEIPSPRAGVIAAIAAAEGQVVPVGSVIVSIALAGETAGAGGPAAGAAGAGDADTGRWNNEGGAPPSGDVSTRKHPKRPRDLNQWAKRMVDLATGEAGDPAPEKNEAAAALGRKGGAARAAKLSPERRAEIARNAALKRHST